MGPLVRLMATILFGPGATVSESSRPYYFRETSRGDVVFNPEVREAVDKGEWPLEYADCRVTDPGLLPVVWKMIILRLIFEAAGLHPSDADRIGVDFESGLITAEDLKDLAGYGDTDPLLTDVNIDGK